LIVNIWPSKSEMLLQRCVFAGCALAIIPFLWIWWLALNLQHSQRPAISALEWVTGLSPLLCTGATLAVEHTLQGNEVDIQALEKLKYNCKSA